MTMIKWPKRYLLLLSVVLAWPLCAASIAAGQEPLSLTDAVAYTLENNIGVKVKKELVRQQRGVLQAATGQFDLMAVAGASLGRDRAPLSTANRLSWYSTYYRWDSVYREDTDTYYLGLSQMLRSGVTISPRVSAQSLQNNYDQPDTVNYSEVSLTIAVPLLKGLGKEATGAREMAAQSTLKAQRLAAKHEISQLVFNTIDAYWSLLAAERLLQTAMEARKRADDFHKLLERLIRGGELPPNLSTQTLAKLLSRDADLANSKLAVFRQQQALGLALGYSPSRLADMPRVAAEFPPVAGPTAWPRLNRGGLVDKALKARLDYQALENDLEAARILVRQAANHTKPDLKLSFKAGYSGLSESSAADRYYSSLSDQMTGVNFSTSLVLELPIQNNAARGQLLQRKAAEARTKLRLRELANSIASQVLVTLEALKRAEQEYHLAQRSAEKYRSAVEVATARFKQGEGTIIEVLDLEDKYSDALGTKTGAMQKYAVSLARLRLVTGSLLTEKNGDLLFKPGSLERLPFIEGGPARPRGK